MAAGVAIDAARRAGAICANVCAGRATAAGTLVFVGFGGQAKIRGVHAMRLRQGQSFFAAGAQGNVAGVRDGLQLLRKGLPLFRRDVPRAARAQAACLQQVRARLDPIRKE